MTDLSGSRRRSLLTRLLRATAERVQPPPNQDDLTADPVGAVVVGCHGRPGSDGALRFAAAQARQHGVALFVVIAFAEPIDPDTDEFDTPAAVRRQQARTMAQQALARAVPDPPPHQIVAIAGLPGHVLLSRFPDAGLLVIGAHHKHPFDLLTSPASTVQSLLAHSLIPVVVVPTGWDG